MCRRRRCVFFHKPPSEKEIINDKDIDLIEGYKLIKSVSSDVNKYKKLDTLDQMKSFIIVRTQVKKINYYTRY